MLVVKNLVKTGMTICATIHSPTPFAFNLFDRLMVLLGGSTVYLGRNGESVAVQHMSNQLAKPLPCLQNQYMVFKRRDFAGMDAVAYFEDTNPHLPLFGGSGCEKDNPAE